MKMHLREMRPADLPAVIERIREQNERDGTSYTMQPVFDREGRRLSNIPLALVVVDAQDKVLQAHVWERTVEQMSFGVDPKASACAMREQAAIAWLLREKGYRDQHIFVVKKHVGKMEHELDSIAEMKCTDGVLAHFYRLLDPAENAELREWYEQQEIEQ
jgi:hypothetical protein